LENNLSHINKGGNAEMVDVGAKNSTKRVALAQSKMFLPNEITALIVDNDIISKKGAVFQTANIAGIMAAKKTSELIPLCHPIAIDKVKIDFEIEDNEVTISAKVTTHGKTGVEMEALTACSVAALTIYDMCKAMSHSITISETKLISKTGGKSNYNFEK